VITSDIWQAKELRLLIMAASLVIIIAGMKAASGLLVPFFLAALISVMTISPFLWLRAKGLPSLLAIFLVIAAVVIIAGSIGAYIGVSLNNFIEALPSYQDRLRSELGTVLVWFEARGFKVSERYFFELLNPGVAMDVVANILKGLSSVLTYTLLILFTVVFILLEASSLPIKLHAATSDPASSLATLEKIFTSVRRYLVLKTWISLATGVTVSIWLIVLDRNYPLLWGFVAFLLNFVPNIGSLIAAIPPILLALINTGPLASMLVGLGYLVINVSCGNLIEPRVLGKGLGLSPLVVFLSLVFWGWILGPVGMLLSVPLTMIVKISLEMFESTHWLAILLGSSASAEAAIKERERPSGRQAGEPGPSHAGHEEFPS